MREKPTKTDKENTTSLLKTFKSGILKERHRGYTRKTNKNGRKKNRQNLREKLPKAKPIKTKDRKLGLKIKENQNNKLTINPHSYAHVTPSRYVTPPHATSHYDALRYDAVR